MTIITNCPHCKTTFNVPDAIIAKYKGLVRCAKCSGVFNAIEHQIKASQSIDILGKNKLNINPNTQNQNKADKTIDTTINSSNSSNETNKLPIDDNNSNINNIEALTSTNLPLNLNQASKEEVATPIFNDTKVQNLAEQNSKLYQLKLRIIEIFSIRKANIKDLQGNTQLNKRLNTWGSQQKYRPLFILFNFLLGLSAFLLVCFWQKNNIANVFPSSAPALRLLAKSVGSQLAPLKLKDNPVVSFSDMQKDLSFNANRYVLNVGLQNRYNGEVAMPSLEVSLFDLNEQIVTRRVFHPQTFTKTSDWKRLETFGLRPNEEFPVKLRFETNQAISSFKVVVFYP